MNDANEHIPGTRNAELAALSASGARVAWCAAGCWMVLGLESILRPWQENYRDLLWMLPFALTAVAFCYVHAVQRSNSGSIERFDFYAVLIASLLAFLGNLGLLTGESRLAIFGFPWGAILWAAGLLLFGMGTWQAKILPRYAALALILLEPASILTGLILSPIAPLHDRGAYSAGVEKALALVWIALGLRTLLGRSSAGCFDSAGSDAIGRELERGADGLLGAHRLHPAESSSQLKLQGIR